MDIDPGEQQMRASQTVERIELEADIRAQRPHRMTLQGRYPGLQGGNRRLGSRQRRLLCGVCGFYRADTLLQTGDLRLQVRQREALRLRHGGQQRQEAAGQEQARQVGQPRQDTPGLHDSRRVRRHRSTPLSP